MAAARTALMSSSTSLRLAQLRSIDERIASKDLDPAAVKSLLQVLFWTHSSYQDRPSRRAVQECLVSIISNGLDPDIFAPFVAALARECARPGIAATVAFVLVEWCSILTQHLAETPQWERFGPQIVQAHALVLEICLGPTSKPGVSHSAIIITRRGLRKLLGQEGSRAEQSLKDAVSLLTAKGGQPTSRNAPYLGIIAGVSSRIPQAQAVLVTQKSQYLSFFSREVISSRTSVPKHIAAAFTDFFMDFASLDDIRQEIVPSLEKSLLRAPEVVLCDVLVPLVQSLPKSFDLSEILAKNLLKPILSGAKSSSPAVRAGVASSFAALCSKAQPSPSLDQALDEVLVPLKSGKIPSVDQRLLHAQMLEQAPYSHAKVEQVASALATVVAKEGNELCLQAETATLASCCIRLSLDVPKAVLDAFVKGLADKKLPLRRTWILRTGQVFSAAMEDDNLAKAVGPFAEATLPKLLESYNEVIANPLSAAQGGIVVSGYIIVAVAPWLEGRVESSAVKSALSKVSIPKQCLAVEPKPSFLLNPRIYSKITAEDEFRWLGRALLLLPNAILKGMPRSSALAWAEGVIFLACSSSVNSKAAKETREKLSAIYASDPATVSSLIIDGIWHWLKAVELADKESAAVISKSEEDALHPVLKSICLSPEAVTALGQEPDTEHLDNQLCSLVVLGRPDLVGGAGWIDLCLKADRDPGDLARQHEDSLLDHIVQATSVTQESTKAKEAAFKAAAELAFVAPPTMTPRIVALIKDDLDSAQLDNVGPVEAAIYKTPEGTAFVDILAKKSQNVVPNKNAKDYDILMWEEELRAQLASKKGQEKKLSADDAAKVKAQLKKEAAIRESVRGKVAKLERGIGITRSLATGPPTEDLMWLWPAISSLLGAINAGACLITGDSAPKAFISCSERITNRLGPTRPFVGVATLRAMGVSSIPAELTQEPVEDLVTRILYRLRFAGEQRPFDTVSFVYMVPLLLHTLRTGGVGATDDDKDANIVLAIEVLAFHSGVCSDEAVPRSEIIEVLIDAMQRYSLHYKLIKDCFADICRCAAPTMSVDEISVLAKGAIVPQTSVRTAVLQSISSEVDMSELDFSDEIWLAAHDDEDENRALGLEIWEESNFSVSADVPFKMLPYLESKDAQLRRSAARSLAEAVSSHVSTLDKVLEKLKHAYTELAKPRVQKLDEYGMPIKMDLSDPWESRHGLAGAFRELAPYLSKSQLDPLFQFLIENGPLGDQNGAVRSEMLEAANRIIDLHGKGILEKLMTAFESTLEAPDKGTEAADRVNEAVVIMYGALARHLSPGDSKLPVVIDRLIATLSTPSEAVQYAIAECLPPLVVAYGPKSSTYFEQVMETLMTSKSFASQRGAAYGLAGLVKGKGIGALREYRIMSTLKGAMENKKDSSQRESALLSYELLSMILGRIFEPYVIGIVPQLLTGFGDSNSNVRDAALEAAKACFAKLSSYGVKKILPTLLEGLDEQQWRSKRGACDLLGAMAYLDPQQLAQSLPEIIPPLTAVLNDSHKEVRGAANKALKRFGEVITNPEVKNVVSILLKALSDPTKYTDEALDVLIKIHFVHYLDAPSLALVTRILQRGLDSRSATKRKAAQVIGSLAHLTERRDLISHLPVLVAGLKIAAVDPVPTTRATASRALGSLVEKLGEDALPDLIPGLMQTLKSDTGAGDRLGSAQALSEVLAGLGTSRLEETLPTILQNVESSKPAVREGFMSLFIFLPVCFGNSFAGYLGRIIPPILAGLADEVEPIRETALRAGRLLVKNFAMKAVDLLLPELERGLADDSYRIRLSSVELVGDLLFNLTGITAKKDGDAEEDPEEEMEKAREAGSSLREVLGEEKRNKILSALYVCRCDTSSAVRAAAIAVWKALVSTPRTLKELVPTLTHLLIRRLGSTNMEQKVIASNTFGELIRRAGDGVLATVLPTLEDGLQTSTDINAKQGICLALKELISSATEEALEEHEKTLISVVRTALTDSNVDVREAAAEAFDSLQQIFGKRAVDQVLPYLLNLLRSDDNADNALSALLTLLTETTRSNVILPNLIPTLITPPISAFNAKALASLSRVAGPAMNRRLPNIINSLLDNIISTDDEDLRQGLGDSFDTVILSIDEMDGLHTVMNVMLSLVKHEDHRRRAAAGHHLGKFFELSDVDYSRYNQDIIRALLTAFDDSDPAVVKGAWGALTQFTKKLKKEEMEALAPSTRATLQLVGVPGVNLRGFELPKGINAILPIFLQGLMYGTPEQRTQSALGMSDIMDRTSEASLKPFVTQITGPLIRVVSERSTEVKEAILLALNNLLEKMPLALKPFLPQLQRTFAKSLADQSSEALRNRAAKALGTLIKYTPRIDPLVAELVTGCRTSDPGVKTAMLKALFEVVSKAGGNMGEASRSGVLSLIDMEADETDSEMTVSNAKLLGALIKNVPEDVANGLVKNRVMTPNFTSSSVLALNAVLVESPKVLLEGPMADDLPELLCRGIKNKTVFIAENAVLATGKYLLSDTPHPFETTKKILQVVAESVAPGNPSDVRRLLLVLLRTLSRSTDLLRPHVALLAPPVFASVRDPVIPVKLAAEASFVALFDVMDEEGRLFEKYMAGPGSEDLPPTTRRSMTDYFKRVALRLGAQARERREADGGGSLGLEGQEDEKEIWSVGRVDVGEFE
ncbi:probable translation activator GCN1 [Cephalotrichum gorgonifer]|uniref:eIF-2-alpha kinase activator GCN1 n=1 Tax=Cephalotrichum gorgonifer TaxID=2041049 RepID=A0AAE8N6K2_9PEZI|nr:probable translation activator GCN1 [Cephalotrichum gorgonifer]